MLEAFNKKLKIYFCLLFLLLSYVQSKEQSFANFDLNKTIIASSFDEGTNKILLYDKNKNLIFFNLNNLSVELLHHYSDDLIASFDYYDGKIYSIFANGDLVIFDDKFNLISKQTILSFTKNIDKIYFNKDKIFIIYDYKNILIYDIVTNSKKVIQNRQKINSISFSKNTFCMIGWNKKVECGEEQNAHLDVQKILTSLFYCNKKDKFITGDIDGNIYIVGENKQLHAPILNEIKHISCDKNKIYISDNREIYVFKDDNFSLFDTEDNGILDMFVDKNNKLILINQNGSIKIYNQLNIK